MQIICVFCYFFIPLQQKSAQLSTFNLKLSTRMIGIFDSGYGGLTILRTIRQIMPQYDYLYLGDNARTPYGTRSFEVVYEFTLQAVKRLFDYHFIGVFFHKFVKILICCIFYDRILKKIKV